MLNLYLVLFAICMFITFCAEARCIQMWLKLHACAMDSIDPVGLLLWAIGYPPIVLACGGGAFYALFTHYSPEPWMVQCMIVAWTLGTGGILAFTHIASDEFATQQA